MAPSGPSHGVALPARALPPICLKEQQYDKEADWACYADGVQRLQAAVEAEGPGAPYCWGTSGLPRAGSAGGPLLFHAVVLKHLPNSSELHIASFLATQCCDARLIYWVSPPTLLASEQLARLRARIPPQHAHRIEFALLDLDAEWAAVAADFPEANATTLARLTGRADLRYISDWARLLLMWRHGGMWFDVDTVFLQDMRPLEMLQAPSWGYQPSWSVLMNNAAMRLARQPEPCAREIMRRVLERADPRPAALGYFLLDSWNCRRLVKDEAIRPVGFQHISQLLVDYCWLRFEGRLSSHARHPAMDAVQPYLSWNSFWLMRLNASSLPSLAEARASMFLPGAISYHWHNRYQEPPHATWADVLLQRFRGMAAVKCVGGDGAAARKGQFE